MYAKAAHLLRLSLSCCAIDWHCNCSFGIDTGNAHLTDINYADDAVLFTDCLLYTSDAADE